MGPGRLESFGSVIRRLLPECNGFGLGCENGLRDSGAFFFGAGLPLILCAMTPVREMLAQGTWGLARARAVAAEIGGSARELKALVGVLFGEDVEIAEAGGGYGAADYGSGSGAAERYADELAGLLEGLPVEESRTRWHLGLVVPRVANTRERRIRAARVMSLLDEDESNVVRCSAVEGLGSLALNEASLRDEADAMVERFLWDGTTKAMKSRARAAKRRLEKVGRKA